MNHQKISSIILTSLLYITIWISPPTIAQTVYENRPYGSIYDFLDELANDGYIVLNDETKPYSKKYIAQKLSEVNQNKNMSRRMATELAFYRKMYRYTFNSLSMDDKGNLNLKKSVQPFISELPEINFHDSLTYISVLPVIQYSYTQNRSGSLWRKSSGLGTDITIGHHLGLYGSLTDNMVNEMPTGPNMLVNSYTTPAKQYPDNYQYNELRGGITYTWQWGMLGLIKDQVIWGPGYDGSNIIGGNYPSFPLLQLKLQPTKWLSIAYLHGWLNSDIIDSARSYYDHQNYRAVFREKNFAANLISISPWQHTTFSVGNSVIYADMGTNAAYLIPLNFFKSLDHNVTMDNNAGQNAQMFAAFSTRFIPKTHIYASLFIDEITLTKVFDIKENSNTLGYKFGARVSNLLSNVTITAEYTHTRPLVYDHYLAVTTYASNAYTLGHYLKDNAESIYFSMAWAPIKHLRCIAEFRKTDKGPALMTPNNLNRGLPFLGSITASSSMAGINIQWQPIKRVYVHGGYNYSNNSGDKTMFPKYLSGKQHNLTFGTGIGL